MKIAKNTTVVDIDLIEIGETIPASGQFAILPEEFIFWASNESIAEITPLINSGDIIINDGTNDLSASDGIRFLKYPDRAYVQSFGTDVTRVNVELNFEDNLTVTDDGNGKATVKSAGLEDLLDERLISVKCIPGTNCVLEACLLVDNSVCFIKTEEC